MSNFIMLIACLLAGVLLRRSGRLADNSHGTVNTIILHVSLPAVTLRYLHGFQFNSGSPYRLDSSRRLSVDSGAANGMWSRAARKDNSRRSWSACFDPSTR